MQPPGRPRRNGTFKAPGRHGRPMSAITRFVRFEVRKESLPQALTAIKAYVDEVNRKEGGTATYKTFQDADHPTRFTQFMVFRTPAGEEYHRKTAWYKKFNETVGPLCVGAPEVSTVRDVMVEH